MTNEEKLVKELGDQIGYGNMMHLASKIWKNMLKDKWNIEGGEFIVGPCASMVVPCECDVRSNCEWCCGCGWVTKHVKNMKDKK